MKSLKILLISTVLILSLSFSVHASTDLSSEIATLAESYGLDEYSYSFAYYNTETGELISHNIDTAMVAGSLYKVPLAMLYDEMLMNGEIEPDTIISGYQLQIAMELMLVNSNNEMAKILQNNLGTVFEVYTEMSKYFGLGEDETLIETYINGNEFTASYILNVLKTLYENPEDYSMTLEYMLLAQEGDYAKYYIEDVEIAQKYGSYEGALNTMAIVYGDTPFLMVIFTRTLNSKFIGEAFEQAYEYTVDNADIYVENTVEKVENLSENDENIDEISENVENSRDLSADYLILAGIVLLMCLLFVKRKIK